MTNITPCWDRILVEVIPHDKISEGGIYIPDNANENQCEGYIVAVGEGSEDTEKFRKSLPIGSKVIYQKGMCAKIKSEGKEFNIIQVRDIIGIIKENK